jgi:aspartate 1-decarboxylase
MLHLRQSHRNKTNKKSKAKNFLLVENLKGGKKMPELVHVLKAKLKAKITSVDSNAEECLEIAGALFLELGLMRSQTVSISNLTKEKQFDTFVIPIGDDIYSGNTEGIILKGKAPKYGEPGDELVIKAYSLVDPTEYEPIGSKKHQPKIIETDD